MFTQTVQLRNEAIKSDTFTVTVINKSYNTNRLLSKTDKASGCKCPL